MKGGRVTLLQQRMLQLEAEILQAVIPIDIAPEPVNDLDAAAAKRELASRPRRRRRRRARRVPVLSTDVQDVARARRALKLKGMLKP